MLAPNSPLRAAVTALAQPVGEVTVTAAADPAPHTGPLPPDEATTDEPPHRKAARYVWASLPARIYEVLPLLPARGPPLWEIQDSESGEIDPQAQPAPDYEFDQHIAW